MINQTAQVLKSLCQIYLKSNLNALHTVILLENSQDDETISIKCFSDCHVFRYMRKGVTIKEQYKEFLFMSVSYNSSISLMVVVVIKINTCEKSYSHTTLKKREKNQVLLKNGEIKIKSVLPASSTVSIWGCLFWMEDPWFCKMALDGEGVPQNIHTNTRRISNL